MPDTLFELPEPMRPMLDLSSGVYSVINRVGGNWPARSAYWRRLLPAGLGRRESLCGNIDHLAKYSPTWSGDKSGTSHMDPAICELVYSAYKPSSVLDPFAGGPPRGYVASYLGIQYTGHEIRPEQIEHNMAGAHALPVPVRYVPHCVTKGCDGDYDMIFSCPPYFDLEQYGGGDDDLSGMTKARFDERYRSILDACHARLKQGGIMALVVGNHVRKGKYHDLEHLTKSIYYDLGLEMIGDCIIVDPIGSKAMSAGLLFRRNGRVTRCHQHLLIGRKGVSA